MKIFTTKQIVEGSEDYGQELCKISDDPYSTNEWFQHWNTQYVKVDDEKLRLSQIIELIKTRCIKKHKIDETEHCACDNIILILLKHHEELSKIEVKNVK